MRASTIKAVYAAYLSLTDEDVIGKAKQSRERVMQRAAFVNVIGKSATLASLAAVMEYAEHSAVINLRRKHTKYLRHDEYRKMIEVADGVVDSMAKRGDIDYLKSLAGLLQDRLDNLNLQIETIEKQTQ